MAPPPPIVMIGVSEESMEAHYCPEKREKWMNEVLHLKQINIKIMRYVKNIEIVDLCQYRLCQVHVRILGI